jgi:hypothetical protein
MNCQRLGDRPRTSDIAVLQILLASTTLLAAEGPGVNLGLVQDAMECECLDRPAIERLLKAQPLVVAGDVERQDQVREYNVRLLRLQRLQLKSSR